MKLIEFVFRRIIAGEYLKAYFCNQLLPRKKFRMWDIIIRIHRYYENIPEEKEYLKKTIKKGIKRLAAISSTF
jgi:hypothetical protein